MKVKQKIGMVMISPLLVGSSMGVNLGAINVKAYDKNSETGNSYSNEQNLVENKEQNILVPQDYLIVYDYYGMNDNAKEKGWEIIKSLANSTAKGSRFMIQLTKSQLDGHSKMGNGNKTTKLISSDEIKNMNSASELESKLLPEEPNVSFFDKYQNSLRGNSQNGISALYIVDNWTTAKSSDGVESKEQYDTQFIKYLVDHKANTVMAVALYDEKEVKENLVPSQSKAIGFNNYYINANPNIDKITGQFLTTSKSYQKDTHSYHIKVQSENGVKIKSAKFVVGNQDVVNLTISKDGLSATGEFKDDKVGTTKGKIVYEYENNTSEREVTIRSSMETNGHIVKFADQVVKPAAKPVVKKGNVIVSYVNGNGDSIKDDIEVLKDADFGTKYDTTSKKTDEIIKDGKVYRLVQSKLPIEKGTVNDANTKIVYHYTEVSKGSVVVSYVDANGKPIKDDVKLVENVEYGTKYDAKPKKLNEIVVNGKTYKLTNAEVSNELGTVNAESTKVVYRYSEVLKGSVTVSYVDQNGKSIKEDVKVVNGSNYGTKYNTESQKLSKIVKDGKEYRLVQSSIPNEAGVVNAENTKITYHYEEILKGDVVVSYVDKDGKPLKDDVKFVSGAEYGTKYNTQSKRLNEIVKDGKTYKLLQIEVSNEVGTVNETNTKVVYRYEEIPKGNVIVRYVTSDDKEIQKSVDVLSQSNYGTDYNVTKLKKPEIKLDNGREYVLETVDGEEQGKLNQSTKIITYKYKEKTGSLNFKLVDEDGNDIVDNVSIIKDGPLNTEYDVQDKIKKVVNGQNGKMYKLVDVVGKTKGKLHFGGNEILLKYQEIKSKVTVKFIDTLGNVLNSKSLFENLSIAQNYDATDLIPKTFEHNGHKYVLEDVSSNVKGKASMDTTVIEAKYKEEIKAKVKKVLPNTTAVK